MAAPAPPEAPPGLWEGDAWIAPIEPSPSGNHTGNNELGGDRPLDELVEAVRVTFKESRCAFFESKGLVTRIKSSSGLPETVLVSRLHAGDQVVFLDSDGKKDLLAKVLEVADGLPDLAASSAWVGHWRKVLQSGYSTFGSYPAFHRALEEQGCCVQAQTVRLWVIGDTIGPDDPEDIRRVGVVVEDSGLVQGFRHVYQAVDTLRRAHVRLGQRLSSLSRTVGSALASGHIDADEIIDERSGLTAADFQDSVDILTVSSIEDVGQVPYMLVGRLRDTDQEDINP
jgi:hypothetical protein